MIDHWMLVSALAIVALIVIGVALTLGPAAIIKRRLIERLQIQSRGRLAITYDDGPGPLLTPPLLKLLADYGVRASFFLVGFRADRYPERVEEIAAAGHEVGNHTYWHRHAWRCWPWTAVRDLHQGSRTMSRWMAGRGLFRPPFGKLTTWSWLAARRTGSPCCLWTIDGGDTWAELPDPQSIAQQAADAGGGVVLLHSHDRGEQRQRFVLDVTECLLKAAGERNLRVCTMSEILNAGSSTAESNSSRRASTDRAARSAGQEQ